MQIQQECVNCFRAILNTDVGVDAFKYEKDTVHSLVLILDAKNIITRTQTLMLLSIICTLDPSYFLLIIDAFHHFKLVKREKYRFERLISSISEIKDQEFRANVLCLINTLITHTPEDATRLSLIKDFKQLKLPEIIEVSIPHFSFPLLIFALFHPVTGNSFDGRGRTACPNSNLRRIAFRRWNWIHRSRYH